jgi:hypothetical protein
MTTPRRNWYGTNCPDYKPRPRPNPTPKPPTPPTPPAPPTPTTPTGGCATTRYRCCPGSTTIASDETGSNCIVGASASTSTPAPSSQSTSLKY